MKNYKDKIMKKQIIAALLLTYGMHALAETTNFIEQLPDKSLLKKLYVQQKKSTTDASLLHSIERYNRGIQLFVDHLHTVNKTMKEQATVDEQKKIHREFGYLTMYRLTAPMESILFWHIHNTKTTASISDVMDETAKLMEQESRYLDTLVKKNIFDTEQ